MADHSHSHAQAAPSHGHDHGHGHDEPHITPIWIYLAVWGALMLGTILTVAASFVHIGSLNVPIMLLIATTKATLVALFFMHLYYDEKFNLVILLAGVFFVALFFVGTLQDMLTRGAVDPIEKNPIAGEMERASYMKQPILLDEGLGAHGGAAAAGHEGATTATTEAHGAPAATTATAETAAPAAAHETTTTTPAGTHP